MKTRFLEHLHRVVSAAFVIAVSSLAMNAAVTQLGSAATATLTNTLSFTIPAGNNRVLIVAAADDQALDIVSVSFGANAMVQRAERDDAFAVDSIWSFNAGTGGATTATITVVSSGPSPNQVAFIGAAAFQGVDQVTPVNGAQTNQSNTVPSASTLNVVSASGNLVFDVFDVFRTDLAGATNVTPGGSQTVVNSTAAVTLPAGGSGVYRTSTRPGSASTPMAWTTADGQALLHLAVNLVAVPTAAGASISGRVMTPKGLGIRNATIVLTDANGNSRTTTSGTFGNYSFSDLPTGATYSITIIGKKYSFSDPTRVVNLSESLTSFDWVADGN